MIGGRQYIVFTVRFLTAQRLKGAKVNDKIILNKVLLVGTKMTTYIGQPVVTNTAMHTVVEDQDWTLKGLCISTRIGKTIEEILVTAGQQKDVVGGIGNLNVEPSQIELLYFELLFFSSAFVYVINCQQVLLYLFELISLLIKTY